MTGRVRQRGTAFGRAGEDLANAIKDAGLPVSATEFVEMAATALRRHPRRLLADPATQLDTDTRRMLEEGGMTFTPLRPGEDRSVIETAADYARLLADSGSVREVSARLGVTDGRVRQMLRAGDLYAMRERDVWRVPWFQFDGNRPIRGIDGIARALPPDVHPVAVFRLLMTPSPDLELDDRPIS